MKFIFCHYILRNYFKEFYSINQDKQKDDVLFEYMTYGVLSKVALESDENLKKEYLKSLLNLSKKIEVCPWFVLKTGISMNV
ncbi:hypothetical protein HNP77_002240 [Treponema rectale]|uniref:Uncharacterized protein n=1 Tax=Treponema rectale TaxID=744512 RepID=A0A840SKG9_9SPIR|nr:hypothetical protein [Treponema rectale]MBB5219851.1 hypothetical protein [Treponema rectale]